MENNNSNTGIQISKKAFFSSVAILFCLMMAAGILTYIIPGGAFEKIMVDGKESIIPGTFQFTGDGGYPIWRWFTAPFDSLTYQKHTPLPTNTGLNCVFLWRAFV